MNGPKSIINAGVGINFRDANGWTPFIGLHIWKDLFFFPYFCRENMVAALLAAGASAGLVTDPHSTRSSRQNSWFYSVCKRPQRSRCYLLKLPSPVIFSSLTIQECEISKVSAELEADIAVESISQRSAQLRGGSEDELTIKDSLAAVRNATQAAARIQAAFRAHSSGRSRKKLLSCTGRKDFLTLRKHVVKIQAHVRGHQVRKKYREILRAVSVIEKIVLRWRRRGSGLRGFEMNPNRKMVEVEEDEEEEDVAKAAVLRMLGRYQQAKADSSTPDEATSRLRDDFTIIEGDDFMYSS
uniref:Uncharacterized protein n=1 Tax=Ananas comosus var. bracteatus TaxID=296719 RepID=A0A6V7P0M6_ANACO|nr:unnamed protein product [Ananas comosus var. bracteatus]